MKIYKTLGELELEAEQLKKSTDESTVKGEISSVKSDINYHKNKINGLEDKLDELEDELDEMVDSKEENLKRLKEVETKINILKNNGRMDCFL